MMTENLTNGDGGAVTLTKKRHPRITFRKKERKQEEKKKKTHEKRKRKKKEKNKGFFSAGNR